MNDSESTTPRGLTAMNGWWAASGLIILLVVIGLIAVLIWGDSPSAEHNSGPTPGPTSTSPATPAPDNGTQSALTTAPIAAWAFYYDLQLPVSRTDGPRQRDQGLWSGYTRTPAGALLAAAYLVTATDGPDAATIMRRQSVPGPAASAYLQQVIATPKGVEPGTSPAIGGFRFISYSPAAASVELLLVAPGFNAALPVDVKWQDEDWKIDFERTGGQPEVSRVTGTSGFVPWGAR